MKKNFTIILCAALVVVIIGFSVFMGIRFHVPRNPTYTQTNCGNFRLYISVESTRVRRRQGLEVTVTFKNLTGESVEFVASVGTRFVQQNIFVSGELAWHAEMNLMDGESGEFIIKGISPREMGRYELVARSRLNIYVGGGTFRMHELVSNTLIITVW